jgi:hypothetical protein
MKKHDRWVPATVMDSALKEHNRRVTQVETVSDLFRR